MNCPTCDAAWAATTLACPSCERLVYRDELNELATTAKRAESEGDHALVAQTWQQMLARLPKHAKQHRIISSKLSKLQLELEQTDDSETQTRRVPKALAALGALGLLLWKFKTVAVVVLTKGKLLLLGLTKWKTLLTMVLSLGVYWAAWGWTFALGLVLSIYIHEMGHVAALRRYGIAASVPMFIPGLGAYVRLDQHPATVVEDARVGLAGPWWGFATAVVCYAIHFLTGSPFFAAMARVGAWINLFNLLPFWQLDGSRGFASLTQQQRAWMCVAIGVALFISKDGILILMLIIAIFRAAVGPFAEHKDQKGAHSYAFLVLVLSWMTTITVPGIAE